VTDISICLFSLSQYTDAVHGSNLLGVSFINCSDLNVTSAFLSLGIDIALPHEIFLKIAGNFNKYSTRGMKCYYITFLYV
jgi:hypothetical protein